MTTIYLVEGSWSDYESQGYWAARAFTTLAAAEQYRDECLRYTKQYCEDFWNAFVEKFGEPVNGRDRWSAFRGVKTIDDEYAGYHLAEQWFGGGYGIDVPDVMRAKSPDPKIEMIEGEPCKYHVVEVELVNVE
jgi:hypothetical protein